MANRDALSLFVRDALVAGKTRTEISTALTRAGWSVSEVHDALAAWDETPFSPPIPRPVATVSARDFFVYALTFGLLLTGAVNLVLVLQALVDLAFAEENYGTTRQIRWGVSVLIVMAPLYLWLTLRERRKLAQDPALYRSAMRKWLTYIALLLAAMTLLGDLVATVFALLTGDLTGQFLIKALIIMVVAGGIFLFYFKDIRRGEPQ
jgi:polyferredoxin|tara:strand:+ start:329 stop:949 length:621 start_codon:yes stop_codon:yes gene_type:complete